VVLAEGVNCPVHPASSLAHKVKEKTYILYNILLLIVPDSSRLSLRPPVILKVARLLSYPCLGLPLNLNGHFG